MNKSPRFPSRRSVNKTIRDNKYISDGETDSEIKTDCQKNTAWIFFCHFLDVNNFIFDALNTNGREAVRLLRHT